MKPSLTSESPSSVLDLDYPISTLQNKAAEELFHQLHLFGELRFTGRVDVQSMAGPVSSLYFCLGRLVWFAGGHHPLQQWRRLLTEFLPNIEELGVGELVRPPQGRQGYEILSQLLSRGRISRHHMVSLIETAIGEILFDLIQEQENLAVGGKEGDASNCDLFADTQDILASPITMLRVEAMVEQVNSAWQLWKTSGLAAYSPNLAPMIRSQEHLRKHTTEQTYEILSSLIDGQRTLRSLAQKMNQDLTTLTRALLPYVTHGVISLVEIPAVEEASTPITDILTHVPDLPRPAVATDPQSSCPLIVCIDDSPLICKNLERVLSRSGYRFVGITDPLQAIPMLLKLNPDLIFLDLIMPVASGYEICAQIRRISSLKHKPVIILTGNDGLVDRVRTKWVGSTEFLAKPVVETLLISTVDRYLRQETE